MPLLDVAAIMGRAQIVRQRAGLLGKDPPYSTRQILATVFPDIVVTGADLPTNVTELAEVNAGRRVLYYNRHVTHSVHRVALMHGLHHHLTDLKFETEQAMRECNLVARRLWSFEESRADPFEVACDLFAANVLIPLDVLDRLTPAHLFPKQDPDEKQAFDDECDSLASRFNVPVKFLRWQMNDLGTLRRSHFHIKTSK